MIVDLVINVGVDSISVEEAAKQLADLLARVQAGAEVTLTQAGKPVARLVPIRPPLRRIPDTMRASLWVARDFDAPLPDELLAEWEGKL